MAIKKILQKMIGSRNDRYLKKVEKTIFKINLLSEEMKKLSNEELQAKTLYFKERLAGGKTLDNILVEAFAVVREASERTLGMRHYDVQLIGGIVLHDGKIAEMRTGEGKTLVATTAVYLNALAGKGVHVITVNDYLATRDAKEMSELYSFLGLTTGVIVSNLPVDEKHKAYNSDITYGTNNEFGFDYLRDNMVYRKAEQAQRSRPFVVIDEVDSILIDEARTPLVISGASDESSDMYLLFTGIVPYLKVQENEEADDGDYYLDEKSKQTHLTDAGHEKLEQILKEKLILKDDDNLYSPQHVTKMHYFNACLRAYALYTSNVDYIVKNNEIIIIDENTGRAMEGRRWSDGLHQAIEAKEGVEIQGENKTMASITFQNFFKLYDKLSGMTGTADTEAFEFHEIYDLEVIVVPTNLPPKRVDLPDVVYLTVKEKFLGIAEDIKESIARGQPVLIGTASIESSEILSTILTKKKVKHSVLNAKQHEKESGIIAQAGAIGSVTIATNMAGRGTDIILGGNWKVKIANLVEPTQSDINKIKDQWLLDNATVKKAGGLYVLGSERHDSRRVDNQLRGRSGRQGDEGKSRFYLSLDDNLVRIFAGDRMKSMLSRLGMGKGEAIESKMVSNAIAKAQSKVETYHYDIRKSLLDYDDVSSEQRTVIYTQRENLLQAADVCETLSNMRYNVASDIFDNHIGLDLLPEQWDLKGTDKLLKSDFLIDFNISKYEDEDNVDELALKESIINTIDESYLSKIKDLPKESIAEFEKMVMLQSLDTFWREHLNNLDHLRDSINLRSYAQKDPKKEYKKEAFELFSEMLDNFKYEVVSTLAKVELQDPSATVEAQEEIQSHNDNLEFKHDDILDTSNSHQESSKKQSATTDKKVKVKRNDLCPCGSGKKYKQCHGLVK